MTTRSILVTGANRGIGLEVARQYAGAGWKVYAACRDPAGAAELTAIRGEVAVREVDIARPESVEALARGLAAQPLDIVVCNAGICPPEALVSPEQVRPEHWMPVMAVNAFGSFATAAALRDNLAHGTEKKLVAVTSALSSMARNETGGFHVYRASKSALNSLWRSLAAEWRPLGITCLLLHPGIVATRLMAQANMPGGLDPEMSVAGMRRVIGGATLADSGRFLNWEGADMPW